ncbi:MAG: PAS domain S-box protein, partial [Nitrosomonas sp.]|nr:PAS domain S-box protein [Nitrosomonas sp.]
MKPADLCLENVAEYLKVIFDKSQEAAISVNQEGVIIYCNPSASRMFGYSKSQLINKKINLLMSQPHQYEQENYLAAYCHTSIKEATNTNKPAIGLRRDSSDFPLGVSANEVELKDSLIYIGLLHDLTAQQKSKADLAKHIEALSNSRAAALSLMEDAESERRRSEQALTDLAASEGERYKLARAVEQSPASVAITDESGCIEYVNPAFCKMSGYGINEVIGKTHSLIRSDRTTKEQNEKLWADIRAGRTWVGEFRNMRKNGEPYWVWSTVAPVRNNANEITNYIGVSEDITQWKETQKELNQFKTTLDKTKDCVFMFRPDTFVFFYANQGASEQFGYSTDEFMQMTLIDLIPEYDEDCFNEILLAPLLSG